jgi:serine/threonine protein kinase
MALDGGSDDDQRLCRIRDLCPDVENWRALLSAIPLDKLSFQLDVGVQRDDAIDALAEWCQKFCGGGSASHGGLAAETYGYLSILVITLTTMASGSVADSHDCAHQCKALIETPEVRAALLSLYTPSATECPPGSQYAEEWDRVRETELHFHKHGSTSFILSGLTRPSHGRRAKFALKCVLFPCSNVPMIANKTRTYADDHNSLDDDKRPVEHMVHVWASTSHWIIMDFATGATLAEEIERLRHEPVRAERSRRRGLVPAGNVRLDLIRRVGLALLTALGELHASGKHHEDLSPSNIIVRRRDHAEGGPDYDLTFVDLGRNYLHTGVVGGQDTYSQLEYVAPEVRDNDDDTSRADVYSLGRILITLGNVGGNRDGTIPDRFYGQAPLIARLIEDLIDERPDRRLLVFAAAWETQNVYLALREILEQELDATQAELTNDVARRNSAIPSDRESVRSILAVIPPSREPGKRRRIYRLRQDQGVLSDPRRSMYARWLLSFSVLSSFVYFVTSVTCVYWFFRDIGVGITNPAGDIFLRLIHANPDSIPIIDNIRLPDYHIGQVWHNLPARIIGLSFSLAAVRYYQNIIGGLTTRVANSPAMSGQVLRVSTEVAIRVVAVWPSWLILGANLVEVRWWPLASAIGYTWIILSNVLTARYATKHLAIARERGLSTVPPEHQKISGLESFRQWGPTISLYSLAVWVFGILIYEGVLKDVFVYASTVAVVNLGLFYVIKTGMNAADIRAGLNRCFLASERLRYDAESTARRSATAAIRTSPAVGV